MNNPGNDKNTPETTAIAFPVLPVAYVRPVVTAKGKHYAVCTTDGTQLAIFATEDAAYFAAKQHDLEPVLLH